MNICVFQRYELKYLLTPEQYSAVLGDIERNMTEDSHGKSTIQSLYYDTPNYRLIRASLEKPVYKEKLRLRSYGLARECDTVFMELKKKFSGIVYKRRIELISSDVADFMSGKAKYDSQIAREIEYFTKFYGELAPRVLLLYDRTAYFGEGDLRVTFDSDIRYRTDRLSLGSGLDGTHLHNDGTILMEIKTGTAIPLWLVKVLSREKIRQASFSKYGEVYKTVLISTPEYEEVRKVG